MIKMSREVTEDVCQDLVARIMVKGKPKCSFLSKECKRKLSLGMKQREFYNFANLIVIQVTSVNFLFHETYGKVHEDFHVPFKTRKARYMEISMYLATTE